MNGGGGILVLNALPRLLSGGAYAPNAPPPWIRQCSDAGGALRVTGVGPTELPVAGCQRHWCGAPWAPMWGLRRHWCLRGGDIGPSDVSVWCPHSRRWRLSKASLWESSLLRDTCMGARGLQETSKGQQRVSGALRDSGDRRGTLRRHWEPSDSPVWGPQSAGR